jgi:hypothetical protein
MDDRILIIGMALSFLGGLLAIAMDAWLSQLLLLYFDAVEANVAALIEAVRAGGSQLVVTEIDRKRDRRLDRARGMKTVGWLVMVLGFAVQLAAVYLARVQASL